MKEPQRQFFVIVPEQSTMQGQKDIVRLHPRRGTMNIDIVSFERLAYRIFGELSLPQPEILDDTGKTMVLRKLAGEQKDQLLLFSAHLNQTGFIDEIKSMLSEFYQYGVTPEALKEQMEKGDMGQVLQGKLTDMNVIYRAFQAFMRERYITAEELLDVLCRVAERSRLLRDSVLVLDGYTGFTPVQYRLLGQLLKLCREMYVTVTATGDTDLYGPGDEADLFLSLIHILQPTRWQNTRPFIWRSTERRISKPSLQTLWAASRQQDLPPVSYTHLDVYKRQFPGRCGEDQRRGGGIPLGDHRRREGG